MLKKIRFAMVNIVPFVLICLILFLPMFNIVDANGKYKQMIFGFNLIGGLMHHAEQGINDIQILKSTAVSFVMILLPLSIFILQRLVKHELGKSICNFLLTIGLFVYVFLVQFYSYTLLDDSLYGVLDFEPLWGYVVNLILIAVYIIYFTIELIILIKKSYKEQKSN